jgi:hypothetical protein
MEAERQHFTFRQTRRTVPITFSIMLVQASERRRSFVKPSRVTVRISSMPSKIEPETPGPVSFETLGEVADQLFGLVGVVQLPCLSQHVPDRSVRRFEVMRISEHKMGLEQPRLRKDVALVGLKGGRLSTATQRDDILWRSSARQSGDVCSPDRRGPISPARKC